MNLIEQRALAEEVYGWEMLVSTEQSVHIRRFFAVRQADVDAENAVELAALDFGVVVVHQCQTFFEVAQRHRVALVRLGVFAAFRRGVRVFDADVNG